MAEVISPELIFFDAAGTLIKPAEHVGITYSRLAANYGIASDPIQLQRDFTSAFRRQPPLTCPPGLSTPDLQRCERQWWRRLVDEVFDNQADDSGFEAFFADVFEHFRRPEAWHVFPEVTATLAELRGRGLRLAVLSNFDSRLVDLLAGLQLMDYFDAVHISTRLGAAKPDPAIFHASLQHHRIEPSAAWHVGDSLREDIEGAASAGLRAIWLDRNGDGSENGWPTRIVRLDQLLDS